MTYDILVSSINEVYIKITAEDSINEELIEFFSFRVPDAHFSPAYNNRHWDGYIRLLTRQGRLYRGLVDHVVQFAKDRSYSILIEDEIISKKSVSLHESEKFMQSINKLHVPRDYQVEAFTRCCRDSRAVIVSPTGSGKSLIIDALSRAYSGSVLIVVPTINLVEQMKSDLLSYGNTREIHTIQSGKDHTITDIVISTWQSIQKETSAWFNRFETIIGDECHQFKASSLKKIMEKATGVRNRFGFTGTLNNVKMHKLVIMGLFGPAHQMIKTNELIERGQLSNFEIKCLMLKYTKEERQRMRGASYQDEIAFLISHGKRNTFVKNLALSLKGNTLILFRYVENHGKSLYESISKEADGRKVYFVHGKVHSDDRENIRKIAENNDNVIIVASEGTFSQGINIRNLENLVTASPSKSKIRVLQSIGRVLRTTKNYSHATLYDIVDDLQHNNRVNFTMKHFVDRIRIYNEEKFEYKNYSINL